MAENIENLKIVKYCPQTGQLTPPVTQSRRPDLDAHILAMFLLWAKAPRKAEPDADGFYSLGEAPEKTWTKATPYSLAQPKI